MKHGETRFLSCMYVLSLLLLAGFAFHGLQETQTVSAAQPTEYIIILDAGHGGPDGGTSGGDGTRESDLNLSITLKTDAILGLLGEKTKLVRDSDTDISDAECQSISQKKVSDIRNRVALANGTPNGIFVSIHCNYYPESKYHGAQVFYNSIGESRSLAEALQAGISANVDPENNRQAKEVSGDIYLFRHTEIPGILVECGFLSNSRELNLLKSNEYQLRLAVNMAVTLTNSLFEESLSQV